jgi:hypothetical protein
MKRCKVFIFLFFIALITGSCATIKPWERVYLNDPQMQLTNSQGSNFSNYVHSIREGGIPAGSTKSSGGCGCN